ncbi:MAG: suppressor of fused domain protein [Micromonosporaceae bacterium]|nr:suppressor of fused domain protein [Micromonosporaceae bacterium]
MADAEDGAPGWEAIDRALQQLYPGVVPKHYGTLVKWSLGGPDPLDGISVYRRDDHWHFVSYGMSELYAKESDDPEESGWGFELTLRLARPQPQSEPPVWALALLQNLARYVFDSGNSFAAGHHVDLNGPISLTEPQTAIRAVVFTEDPELPLIDTPHGRLRFLQLVGITLEEYAAIERWDAAQLLQVLATHLPLFVTDLARADLTAEPSVAAAIAEGVRRDGSSTGSLFVQESGWQTGTGTTLTFGAKAAEGIARVLPARLSFGRGLLIDGPDRSIELLPGDRLAITHRDRDLLELQLPAPVLDELAAALRPVAGTYRLPSAPGLTVEIVKSQIRDRDGNIVAEVG